jgi:hypothetical protein
MLSSPVRKEINFRIGETRPIARLVHTAVARRCAGQEVDPRFSRLAALTLVNRMAAQANRGSKPELLTPNRKRFSLGGGRRKKNEEVNSSTPE